MFLFCLAAATAAGNEAQADAAVDAGPALPVAVLIGALVGALAARVLHLVEDIGALLSLALWFLFGAVLNDVVERGSITWQIVLFAALVLTVAACCR